MKKKKILLLSDDLRMHSGIATQSKEFVMGTLHKYDWVQLGGAVQHPEQGKIIDMSQAVQNQYGVKDAYLKIYPIFIIFFGKGVRYNIKGWVVAPTNPAIKAAAKSVCCLKYGFKSLIKGVVSLIIFGIFSKCKDINLNTTSHKPVTTKVNIISL